MAFTEQDLIREARGYGAVIATRQDRTVHLADAFVGGLPGPQLIGLATSMLYDRVRDSFIDGRCAEVLVTRPLAGYRGWDDPGLSPAAARMTGSWYSPLRPSIRSEFRRSTAAAVRYSSGGGGNRISLAGKFTISPGPRILVGRASPQSDVFQRVLLPGGAIQFYVRREDLVHVSLDYSWDVDRGDPGVRHTVREPGP